MKKNLTLTATILIICMQEVQAQRYIGVQAVVGPLIRQFHIHRQMVAETTGISTS